MFEASIATWNMHHITLWMLIVILIYMSVRWIELHSTLFGFSHIVSHCTRTRDIFLGSALSFLFIFKRQFEFVTTAKHAVNQLKFQNKQSPLHGALTNPTGFFQPLTLVKYTLLLGVCVGRKRQVYHLHWKPQLSHSFNRCRSDGVEI